VPAEVKIGAHLPFSLKYRLDGAALALRRTRRDASAKTLLSALVWLTWSAMFAAAAQYVGCLP